MVLRFVRSRPRRRQHRLQPRQPDPVQRAGLAGRARVDSRRCFDSVPNNVPVPFRDYLGTCASTGRSRRARSGSCAAAIDNYTTDNALVQQATLPSTGATSHSNYMNLVLGQQYIFSPTWLGRLPWRQRPAPDRRLATPIWASRWPFPSAPPPRPFPDSKPSATTSSSRRSRPFPILRNQEKYQVRYAVTPLLRPPFAQLRRRFHPRAGAERRASGQRREPDRIRAGSRRTTSAIPRSSPWT